jgi:hypothetical protein
MRRLSRPHRSRGLRVSTALTFILLSLLTWIACNGQPVAPSGPTIPRDFSGAWSGQYDVRSCSPYPGNCGRVDQQTLPSDQPVTLTLTQASSQVSGTLRLSGWLSWEVPVTGTVSTDGFLSLSGTATRASGGFCNHTGSFKTVSWGTGLDPLGGRLTGQFSFATTKLLSSCYYVDDLLVVAYPLEMTRTQ